MESLTIDPQGVLLDATSVTNAFISEYMPAAPEGYAKVYLYGLMLAHSGYKSVDNFIEVLASALDMKENEVTAALRYWERAQLIERVSDQPPVYRYRCVQQVLLQKQQLPHDDEYERFSVSLYAIFGDKRKLHGNESSLAFEWVEKLGLEPEIVLMLIKHLMNTRGVRFSFKDGQKEALALKELGITTVDEAEAYFCRSGALYKGCCSVLRTLGMRRQPSEPELELYKKWTVDWKIENDAVIRACDETVKGNPNFGYLDGIISNIRGRLEGKIVNAESMESALNESRQESEQIRILLTAMGQKRIAIDDGLRLVYRELQPYGQELLLLAAKRCGLHENTRTLDCLQELLTSWSCKGLNDAKSVSKYLQEIDEIDSVLRHLSQKAGNTIACSNTNRNYLRKWMNEWHMPLDMIELAAEYSTDTRRNMPYIDKLLDSWQQQGILSAEAAVKEHDSYRKEISKTGEGNQNRSQKRVIEQQYEQRPTTPDMDDLPPELLEEVTKL